MKMRSIVDAAWFERKIDRLLTPNGLMTVVALILLSAFLLSGSGIERRTQEVREDPVSRTTNSPLLGNP